MFNLYLSIYLSIYINKGFPVGSDGEEFSCNSIPELGRSPGKGNI